MRQEKSNKSHVAAAYSSRRYPLVPARRPKNYVPSILDLSPDSSMGWRLEAFIMDLIRCKEGLVFTDIAEADIFSLFNRRSGPVAAAVAFSVEMPAV